MRGIGGTRVSPNFWVGLCFAFIFHSFVSNVQAESDIKQSLGKEGYWHLIETQEGVWWFVGPDGKREFLNRVTTVVPKIKSIDSEGPDFISKAFGGAPNFESEKNLRDWADFTVKRVKEMGFKGLGAWSHPIFHHYDIPFSRDLNLLKWMIHQGRLYSKEPFKDLEKIVRQQVEPLKNNKNLIGYYLDNEIDWFENIYIPYSSQASKFQKIQLVNFATTYFSTITKMIKRYDPNHLILGVRFKGAAPIQVVRASRNFVDVESINYYPNDARLDEKEFRALFEESKRPILLSEFSFHALQNQSGNRNTAQFVGQVFDQEARGEAYTIFLKRLAKVPYIVGADWFQWADEPPSGRVGDGEDVNFGVVDVYDQDYKDLQEAVRRTAPLLNDIHDLSPRADLQDVWRMSAPPPKPVQNIAKVKDLKSIFLAPLSDWPKESKIHNIRVSEIIGLERNRFDAPDVHLALSDEGLALCFKLHDANFEGNPGIWWSKDFIEFWINADNNAHHFILTPAADKLHLWHWELAPKDKGEIWIDSKEVRTRLLKLNSDHYEIRILIPGFAIQGFKDSKSDIGFNFNIRNYEHALDYYWSASKLFDTQDDPKTWGQLILEKKNPVVAITKE